MNTKPSIFNFESDSAIRAIIVDGEPWFFASDVCRAIGIANHRDAVRKLDDDEKGVGSIDTLGGEQESVIISESGLYTLILRCRDAVTPGTIPYRFRKWVTSEVLPQIRKTGHYVREELSPADKARILAQDNLNQLVERLQRIVLEGEFIPGGSRAVRYVIEPSRKAGKAMVGDFMTQSEASPVQSLLALLGHDGHDIKSVEQEMHALREHITRLSLAIGDIHTHAQYISHAVGKI